jgi:hypothetical protein
VAILIIVGNLAILCVGSYYEITDYRHEVGGLESFEDFYFGYLPKLPSSSSTTSKRALEKSAQRKSEKGGECGSHSRNSLSPRNGKTLRLLPFCCLSLELLIWRRSVLFVDHQVPEVE